MENQPPTSIPSFLRRRFWLDIDPITLDTPIHFQIPMGPGDPDMLLSVDGSGKHGLKPMRRDPDILAYIGGSGKRFRFPASFFDHDPCARSVTMPTSITSFGDGPLILVDADLDGNYFTRANRPSCVVRSCPSVQDIVNRVCSSLGRPLPFCYDPPYPRGDDFVASLVNPPSLDIIANCLSSPCMFTVHRNDWGITFYIRVDLAGLYHTYPQVDGGPFESLENACRGIKRDLEHRRVLEMSMRQPNDSQVDYVVRQCLHWPDGTRKKRLKSGPIDVIRDQKRHLVQALVDKYNDYLGDTAYVLKDVVQCTTVHVRDCYRITYHINFTARAKGTKDSDCSMDDLFFAEVTSMTGDETSVVSCFCRVKTTDNGGCYGCNAKHPNGPVYSCGVEGACFPFGGPDINLQYVDEDLEGEERRVRRYYKDQGLDNPGYFEKLRAIMAGLPVVNY